MQQQPVMGIAPEIATCDMSMEELLLHALIMEKEAVQRYELLAEMMELAGNRKVAKIFAKMSRIEAKHVARIEERIADPQRVSLERSGVTGKCRQWPGLSPDESAPGHVPCTGLRGACLQVLR